MGANRRGPRLPGRTTVEERARRKGNEARGYANATSASAPANAIPAPVPA
jgi:hypothetical protein